MKKEKSSRTYIENYVGMIHSNSNYGEPTMHKTKEEIKSAIREELKCFDKPGASQIISLNLQMASNHYGQDFKDELIDEFKLEKYGWKSGDHEIKRFGEHDFENFVF